MTATIILAFYLAFASRIHGGLIHTKKAYKNALWALPFGIATCVIYPIGASMVIAGLVSFTGGFLKGAGHGAGMDLGHNPKEPNAGRSLEKVEHLIYPWLYNRISRYWYDVILMALTGLVAVIVPSLVIGWANPLSGVLVALGGLLKGLAYMIGWKIFPKPADSRNTETGEILTGLFAGIGLGLAVYVI